jgi:hypothetical protein
MRAYVLSCAHQVARRQQTVELLRRAGLDVVTHIVERDSCPRRGAYISHVSIARRVATYGHPCLIVEDDARGDAAALRRWLHELPEPNTYDLFYAGLNPQRADKNRVAGFCLHGYVLSPRGARRVSALPPYAGVEIDRMIMEMCGLHNPDWQHSWQCLTSQTTVLRQDKRLGSDITPNDPRYRLNRMVPLETIMHAIDQLLEIFVMHAETHVSRITLQLCLIACCVKNIAPRTSAFLLALTLLRLERI